MVSILLGILKTTGLMQDTNSEPNLLSHMDGLYRYAVVLCRNSASASDLVQETYLRALASRSQLREDSNVKGWLFTILRNIWLNQLRKLRTAPEQADVDMSELVPNPQVGRPQDPHSVLVRKVEAEEVRKAIRQLPEDFREIIVLREYEELSYQEIAQVLNCPAGTVMSRLARARSRLRTLLAPLHL
jgi:RNA polymerase sigma-70 factor (ECF subfamily)